MGKKQQNIRKEENIIFFYYPNIFLQNNFVWKKYQLHQTQ